VLGVDSTPGETLRLFVVLVEDSVRSDLVGATDSVFNRVMRAMLPGVEGRPVFLLTGDTVIATEQTTLDRRWRPEHLGIVAFVQEPASHTVLQAAGIRRLLERR